MIQSIINITTYRLTIRLILLLSVLITVNSCQEKQEKIQDNLPAIRVKVLNGCGFSGAASEMSNYLSRFNIDVIGIGNADQFIYDKTIIIVKKDDQQDLERLIRYTKISRRAFALSDDAVESFQIIVGKDYLSYLD